MNLNRSEAGCILKEYSGDRNMENQIRGEKHWIFGAFK